MMLTDVLTGTSCGTNEIGSEKTCRYPFISISISISQ